MYCIKCGGVVSFDSLSCFHCGMSIDHTGNIHSVDWHSHNKQTQSRQKRIRLFLNEIHVSFVAKAVMWSSLIIPALLMTYVFRLIFEKYRNLDSVLLDSALTLIIFSVFYFTNKAISNSKIKR